MRWFSSVSDDISRIISSLCVTVLSRCFVLILKINKLALFSHMVILVILRFMPRALYAWIPLSTLNSFMYKRFFRLLRVEFTEQLFDADPYVVIRPPGNRETRRLNLSVRVFTPYFLLVEYLCSVKVFSLLLLLFPAPFSLPAEVPLSFLLSLCFAEE